jgi:RimJ/RimL family protein N-acetyltransferase
MDTTNIFLGEKLRLTEIHPKTDAETEADWMQDMAYVNLRKQMPARPLSVTALCKDLEEKLKESDEGRSTFYYAIRERDDESSLVGFMYVVDIEWKNGQGFLQLLFKDEATTHMSMPESLQLALRYVFDELSLVHICMEVLDYAEAAITVIENAGFQQEARLREIAYHAGAYHDHLIYGLLAEEWRQTREDQA